jgi:hypothetical protein
LLDNFTKAHIFQKINVDFEKDFCKHLYFRFQIQEGDQEEEVELGQGTAPAENFIKVLINFGSENHNDKVRR